MSNLYRRPDLAAQMAQQLLDPGPLDDGLRSGLFLSGPRRTGKPTFISMDLIPAIKARGALVIYVDLWADVSANPSVLIRTAIRNKLREHSYKPVPFFTGTQVALYSCGHFSSPPDER